MQRYLLFQRREMPVYPTNETVQQVFARLSAYRDMMDGPQVTPTQHYLFHISTKILLATLVAIVIHGRMEPRSSAHSAFVHAARIEKTAKWLWSHHQCCLYLLACGWRDLVFWHEEQHEAACFTVKAQQPCHLVRTDSRAPSADR